MGHIMSRQVGWISKENLEIACVRMVLQSEPKPPDMWLPVFWEDGDAAEEIVRLRTELNKIKESTCPKCTAARVAKDALQTQDD